MTSSKGGKTMDNKKQRYTTYISTETKDNLAQLSEITRVPMSQYVEEAIDDLIIKYKKELESNKK